MIHSFNARVTDVISSGVNITKFGESTPMFSEYICKARALGEESVVFAVPPDVAGSLIGKLVRVTVEPEDEQ